MRRSILVMLIFVHCVGARAADVAVTSELERLFDAGRYEQFMKLAAPLARKGDPDALFLLGKAHHSGKGVAENAVRARAFYEQAAEKNHARATHNLGSLAMTVATGPGGKLMFVAEPRQYAE